MFGIAVSPLVRACHAALDPSAPDDYRRLAALLVDRWRQTGRTTVGIGGGQGAGKSTLGRLLRSAGTHFGLRIEVLSIDDFYLGRQERTQLARDVHPLFGTRGPPGTHDAPRLMGALSALRQPGDVLLPRFDKGIDDRVGDVRVQGGADIVVLEGWCVGAPARPRSETLAPLNALEREQDLDQAWRMAIDNALAGPYADLNAALDGLVFLQVPDLDAVRRWRLLQERERPPAQRMDAEAVARFVAHYERITLRMLQLLPGRADVVVALRPDHGVAHVRFA